MEDRKDFLQCDGSFPERKKIFISLSPEIAFRIEILAEKTGISQEKYIENVLKEHTEEIFVNRKNFYKKYFE